MTRAELPALVPAPAPAWATELVDTGSALRDLQPEWDDLYARSVGGTPFQTHGWIDSWWEQYGRPGRLRVLLLRRDGRLVAAAPLWLVRRGGVRVLAPLGGGQSDHHDVLLDRDAAVPAAERLAAALAALPGWDVLDLAEVRAGAGADLLAAAWPAGRWRTAHGSRCLELPHGSAAAFAASLPKHTAKTVKRKLRRIEDSPITSREVPAAEVPAAVGRLLALHAGQWSGRSISAEHVRPRFARHLAGAVAAMAARDQAVLTEYTHAGRVVILDLSVVGPDCVGTYLAGFEPAMREHVDVAMLMLTRAFGQVERRGLAGVSLLRGDEPYKLRWHPVPARNRRLLLGRGPVAAGYAAAVRLRGAAADAGRERVPWLRAARVRVRSAVGRLR